MNPRAKKILLVVIGIVFLGLIIILSWLGTLGRSYQYEAVVVPPDATFTIDDKPAQPGIISLRKGEHTLKASRQYFEDATVVVHTNDLEPGQKILVLPKATTPEARKWLDEHPEIVAEAGEIISTAQVAEDNSIISERYPIVDKLPYNSVDFKIDFALDAELKISFAVTLYPYAKPDNPEGYNRQLKEFKTEALQFLSENGIDVNATPIRYTPEEAATL